MPDGSELIIVTTETRADRRDRGDAVRRVVESSVTIDSVRANLERFVSSLGELLAAGRSDSGEFALEEVGFSAEIGANGEFKLLGTGVGVSGSSAVTFTWRRTRSPSAG